MIEIKKYIIYLSLKPSINTKIILHWQLYLRASNIQGDLGFENT